MLWWKRPPPPRDAAEPVVRDVQLRIDGVHATFADKRCLIFLRGTGPAAVASDLGALRLESPAEGNRLLAHILVRVSAQGHGPQDRRCARLVPPLTQPGVAAYWNAVCVWLDQTGAGRASEDPLHAHYRPAWVLVHRWPQVRAALAANQLPPLSGPAPR